MKIEHAIIKEDPIKQKMMAEILNMCLKSGQNVTAHKNNT